MEQINETNKLETFFDAYHESELTAYYRIINTPSEFAKENLFYIQESGSLKSLKSHIKQREQLNSYLFMAVLSGSGQFTYKGDTHKLKPGSCLLIDCNYHYSHQSSDTDPWELMWVHFNGKNIKPYITQYRSINPKSVFHTDIATDYTTIIGSCLDAVKINDINSEFIISKMLTDILTLCITRRNNKIGQKDIEKMAKIKEYIDNNFAKKISLNEIAQEFFVSKYYLAREFKKYYGMTIGEYISAKRVNSSKELLRFTNKSIEEIATLCGITDTNYFAKVFRKFEDCSPSDYRKKW
ncbi:AraC family transcriptional regulator [Youngiibacter multivorans]|uniref:AraC-like DNA-binding protein n=1 Tax=Youngiibacter multivorans TaxID=937251 RepID=A0ABS4G6D5_9CLOT|nr:AraC family transcriptional regulator [Youngiibacter multivorans]MBP1920104.1 AraC-like DNA-binding protein [Youngiibacter multivorans]